MSAPTSMSYSQAVQHPSLAFDRDPVLASSSPMPGMFGQPRSFSGNFAIVFQLEGADGRRWAAKCFTHEIADRVERYRAIHDQLHSIDRPWEVEFSFLPEGVLVEGHRQPLVRMEWIDAVGLGAFLRDDKTETEQVEAVSTDFRRVLRSLDEDGIAHGDLQHANILVEDGGRIRLVDYDGMFVPTIAHLGPAENGHPGYQSPHRSRQHFDADLDRHSAWVIHAALRVRALEPALFAELDVEDDGLLFTNSDLEHPLSNDVLERLTDSGGELKALAHDLLDVIGQSPEDVPPFEPPTNGVAVGQTCRSEDECDICGGGLCRLCDRGQQRCAACLRPVREPGLDRHGSVAWRLGNDAVLHIGRRVASLERHGTTEATWVPVGDLDRDARRRTRWHAAASGLPLDVGAVLEEPDEPQPDGPFELVWRDATDTQVAYDPGGTSVKVVDRAARWLEPAGSNDVAGLQEEGGAIADLITRLRRRASPGSPGRLIVRIEQEWARVRLEPDGLRWRSERRTADGGVITLDEQQFGWQRPISDDPGLLLQADCHGVSARVRRLHRSLILELDDDHTSRRWFVPADEETSQHLETVLAAHPLAEAGGILMAHGEPGAAPPPVEPIGAERVSRVEREVLQHVQEDDPRLHEHPSRALTEEDLPRLGLKTTSEQPELTVLRSSIAERLLAAVDEHAPSPTIHPLLPALEVVETWEAHGTATVRYVAEIDVPVGIPHESGEIFTDFTVVNGEIVSLARSRRCMDCGDMLHERQLWPCSGCGRHSRCSYCEATSGPTATTCATCGSTHCSACDETPAPGPCAACEQATCGDCSEHGRCLDCAPTNWRTWTDPLPYQLQANRLRVLGRIRGTQLLLYLHGPRRRELATVEGRHITRWVSFSQEGEDALTLASRWSGASDVAFTVEEPRVDQDDSPASSGLTVSRDRRFAVRWQFHTAYAQQQGVVLLAEEPGGFVSELPTVRGEFGLLGEPTPASNGQGLVRPSFLDAPVPLQREFAAAAERGTQGPDDRVTLQLVETINDVRLAPGGFAVGPRPVTLWERDEAPIDPISQELKLTHLRTTWGGWTARLWRLRTMVMLSIEGADAANVSWWHVTGEIDEGSRLARGCRWLRQPALCRVTAEVTSEELHEAGVAGGEPAVQDPSGAAWGVPGDDAMADVWLDALQRDAMDWELAKQFAELAYTRIDRLPEIPMIVGCRDMVAGEIRECWPTGTTSPRSWLDLGRVRA